MYRYFKQSARFDSAADALLRSGPRPITDFTEGPVGLRLSTWFDATPTNPEGYGSEGGRPGFIITPINGTNERERLDGATTQTIVNLPDQQIFVNAGIYWIPFSCKVQFAWPDITPDCGGPLSYEVVSFNQCIGAPFSYTNYLRNEQTMTVRREVRSIKLSSTAAALLVNAAVLGLNDRPCDTGGGFTARMQFLTAIDPAIQRVGVTCYY